MYACSVLSPAATATTTARVLDLLVAFEPSRSLFDHAALWLALQGILQRNVDVVSERGIKPRIRDRVLREAVTLSRT